MKSQKIKDILLPVSMLLVLLILVVSICILAWVPPVSRDALVHHLAVPKLWLKHGAIYEIPDMIFSYYPMNLDLLYTIPLYFGNDILPKFIHFAFALGTAWLIFTYLTKRLDRYYALLGVLFFLSTPVIVKLSITAYVDLGLIFFSTAGFMYALKWHEESLRRKHLVMAALCSGLALGTKYNGLMVLLLLTLIMIFIASRGVAEGKHTPFWAVLSGLLFVSVAGLMYSPWGIKNYIWTGNPVFPLFDNWFNASDPYALQSVPPIILRKLMYNETWWETALVPLRVFFQGQDNTHQYFDGKLNPALLILPIFSFAMANKDKNTHRHNAEKGIMLIFSILLVLLVFFQTNMRIRYIAPVIPCLVILSMFGLKNIFLFVCKLFDGKPKYIAGGISLMTVLLMLSGNMTYIIEQFQIVTPFQYLSGNISRDDYIEKFRPEYAAIRHINGFLPSEAKILSLFIGDRGYYSDREMLFDINLFHSTVQKSDSAEELHTHLVNLGLTHLLIRLDMFDNWSHNNLNKMEKQLVINFLDLKTSRLFAENGHDLYQLRGSQD
ncbi:MAG: hypothetical protein DRH90_06515 [Deltaproteobacteria bacterium]|nr:MAG: hypothetical protein DRH90_06515 [Deltaproteobacteria bacterium]